MSYREIALHGDHDCWPDGAIESNLYGGEEVGEEEGKDPEPVVIWHQGEGEGQDHQEGEESVVESQHDQGVTEWSLHTQVWGGEDGDGDQVPTDTQHSCQGGQVLLYH